MARAGRGDGNLVQGSKLFVGFRMRKKLPEIVRDFFGGEFCFPHEEPKLPQNRIWEVI